ncbi:hypothetical protein BaRGS_00034327 [Batillaria attramentaria]|uniref:RPA-interacting protein C-terminal domain-containing protein n=1 Tax=Batillaria attramentaria TaxID=370345 RepID=A0ABD0JHR3_9CAEN
MSRQNDLKGASCSPSRSPSHQKMYKKAAANWKETYRKRCLERLQESREELYSKRRGLKDKAGGDQDEDSNVQFINLLMSKELQALQAEQGEDCEMEMWDPFTGDIDKVLSLYAEIQLELLAEEEKLLREYEFYADSLTQFKAQEEAALCSAMELLSAREVICPICEKNPMMENKGIIFCKCGVRINTEQDCIGLEYMHQQLDNASNAHTCDGRPRFSLVEKFGCTNLVMTCETCDFMHIII